MNNQKYDAIIVGTGAGGACTAYQLAKAGLNVLALEKGPSRTLEDFHEGRTFGNSFSSWGRGDELKYIRSEYLMPKLRKEVRFLRYSEPGQPEPKEAKKTMDGWMSQLVGGGTVHYGGASFRMETVDFLMKSTFGQVRVPDLDDIHQADLHDWSLDASAFTEWYQMAEKIIGIAGAPGSDLPELSFNKAAKLIAKGLKRKNSNVKIIPTPMAINSGKHLDRSPCHNSGLCQNYACRFESKSDMRVTLLREAIATGNLCIQAETFVRKLIVNDGQVTGLECVVGNVDDKAEIHTLSAPIVVVACEAIETIRLLKCSGIGNPDILGRFLMFHVTGGARSKAPEPTTTWDTAPHTSYINSFYNDANQGESPFIKTGILLISSSDGPLQSGTPFWGKKALTFYNEIYPYKMDLSYVGEGLPTRYNRVEIDENQKDRYGMPGAVISYHPHPFDLNAGKYIEAKSKDILKMAGGITEDIASSELAPFLGKKTTSSRLFHCSGGCRFGEDPKTSVLNPDCRLHDIDNLYITDASVFPTGSGVNPTLTIQANALRVGSIIVEKFGKC